MIAYLTLSFITIITELLVLKRLFKRGTSNDLKEVIVTRHLAYFLVYLLFLCKVNYDLFNVKAKELLGITVYFYVDAFLYTSGFMLSIIRINEPFVWFTFRKQLLCCLKKKSKLKFYKESLDSFLKSAMNIEYVSIILIAINKSIEQPAKGIV